MTSWTTPADVVRKLRTRYERGEFLAAYATGTPWEPVAVPLRGPSARDLADRFADVQSWVAQWQARSKGLRVETTSVGGRVVGANEVPRRAWVDSPEQLWTLLGVTGDVRRFTELLEKTQHGAPRIAEWMAAKAMDVLRHADIWTPLVDTALWIEEHGNPDMYLRQVDVPGVDTKFIERHRKILAAVLDQQLPADRIDPAYPPSEFVRRYRLRSKPSYVRFRRLGDTAGFTELSVRVDELAARPLDERVVVVVENEVTYLAFPSAPEAVVIFGGGYALSRLEPLQWLSGRELVYWGDIDTHGFAILDRLRRAFPHTRSMLMDRATLLAHEGQWVTEPSPTDAHLPLLRPDEAALYTDLVEGTLGPTVRLEQERVSYSAVCRAVGAVSGLTSRPGPHRGGSTRSSRRPAGTGQPATGPPGSAGIA